MVPAASIVINALIVLLTIYAWRIILMGAKDSGDLAHRGLGSLRYFTVLSNLFSGAVSAIYVAVCVTGLTQLPLWLTTLKLAAATAVMLTFITVVVLLIPVYGWQSMYSGGNLWMHLVLPLLAALDCCLFVPVSEVPLPMTLFSVVPTLAYGVFYLSQIIAYGAEKDGVTYDFYGFLRWGWKRLPVVMAGMLLATWLIALGLRLVAGILGV